MKINEIFYSIQGEGKWVGLPNIFIRTTGCNLRCNFCDTKYAYENGENMSINEIYTSIKNYNCKNICVTGGEPLIQEETLKLIDFLLKKDYKMCLETNGSLDIKDFVNKKFLMISLDIKCPSSNMHEKMFFKNISLLRAKDQIKFIVKNIKDYEYAKQILKKYSTKADIFIQPVWGYNPLNIYNWILDDGLDVRMSLQLHKIICGDKKGF